MYKKLISFIITGFLLFLLTTCSNPVDIVQVATEEVMSANNRFLVLKSQYPVLNATDINPSTDIRIEFDRDIISESLEGNVKVYYHDGVNLIEELWDVSYNPSVRRLTISPFPFLENDRTVTVLLEGIVAQDGSELQHSIEWSFTTNNDVVYSINFGTTSTEKLYYANQALADSRGDNTIPIRLLFTRIDNIKYLISPTITEAFQLPSIVTSSWNEPISQLIEIEDQVFLSDGVYKRYLWVYDTAEDHLISEIPKTVQIIVDRTSPSFDLGSPIFANSEYLFEPNVVETGSGVDSYLWSGENCSFSTLNEVSTSVTGINEGENNISLQITDNAGNMASDTVSFTWDISSPPLAPSIPDLYYGDDTGYYNDDNLTKQTSGLTMTGTCEANAVVQVKTGSTVLGTDTTTSSGSYSIDISRTNGTYAIYAVQTDRAGNISLNSQTMTLTVDTIAISPSIPDLYYGDDTGFYNYDNLTKQTSGLTVTGSCEANAIVQVKTGSTVLGTDTTTSGSTWSIDISRTHGTYAVYAVQTDQAGNVSSNSQSMTLIVDTVASAPSVPDLYYGDDKGYYNSDNLTNQISGLTMNGSCETNATVQVKTGTTLLGTDTSTSTGAWSIDISRSNGTYAVYAVQTDRAGNVSSNSSSLTLYIDTVKPTGSISITGNSGTTSYTRDSYSTLTLSYSSDISYYFFRNDGISTWTTDTSPTTGKTWYLRNNSGLRKVFYQIFDKAGNYSSVYSDTISFQRKVYVMLSSIYLGDDNETGDEEYYWRFGINGSAYAFYRPDAYHLSGIDPPRWMPSVSGVTGYPQAALPYTYSTYVDIASTSGAITIEGRVFEDDGSSGDDTTSAWSYNLSTNVRVIGTTEPTNASGYSLPNGTGGDDLYDVDIFVKRWGGLPIYAATGN